MLKDYQLRQMYQLLTEDSVEGKRSTSITGVPLGKNKQSVDKRKSYPYFLIVHRVVSQSYHEVH